MPPSSTAPPNAEQIRRWRRYLADEIAEGAVYRHLAGRRDGEEREILLELAEAERRHEDHWRALLGEHAANPGKGDLRTRFLGWLARTFGGVFVLALAQRAEARSGYDRDDDATAAMAADERIHAEVVRALAARGRAQISGTFRAAVFGANDGLVSNLALVMGVGAAGVGSSAVLVAGVAGLLSGAMSMAAGEYVSVRSQRELLTASTPDAQTEDHVPALDVDANELALVYRARGLSQDEAEEHATEVIARVAAGTPAPAADRVDTFEEVGTGRRAALSSFAFFASGALIPIVPWLMGMTGAGAVLLAASLVGVALLGTGAVVGLLSGASPLKRALRQLAIGYGAAAITYALGTALGVAV
ncbi:VIT1/CCC1 transporter family protein [Bogoriella caseilytica]|uniref:VIT1/CCC1 family predicted Fe2+/Mn2+ transporter n=1 Tax=Bogoriella caseilytica TaxID=56055 RepID=A0A3N2BCW2_9MICO|nr:VIT1/CCC1 transporter family protein [Bogoriella caseilytica]ROR73062.1 VIT1/CCC1 family predicted Fe2+/Mn2+ transporter [Bogoriella caseilytica]